MTIMPTAKLKAALASTLVAILLSACAAVVQKETKGVTPAEKISSVYAVWSDYADFSTEISTPVLHAGKSKELSSAGIGKILTLLRAGFKDELPGKLRGAGLCLARKDAAMGRLLISPARGRSRCAALGCQNDVDVFARLTDPSGKQVYWTAVIRAGATWPADQTPEVSKAFYQMLMERLTENQLLKAGACGGPVDGVSEIVVEASAQPNRVGDGGMGVAPPRPAEPPAPAVARASPRDVLQPSMSLPPVVATAPDPPAAPPQPTEVPPTPPAGASAAANEPPPLSDRAVKRLQSLTIMLERKALTEAEYQRKRQAVISGG